MCLILCFPLLFLMVIMITSASDPLCIIRQLSPLLLVPTVNTWITNSHNIKKKKKNQHNSHSSPHHHHHHKTHSHIHHSAPIQWFFHHKIHLAPPNAANTFQDVLHFMRGYSTLTTCIRMIPHQVSTNSVLLREGRGKKKERWFGWRDYVLFLNINWMIIFNLKPTHSSTSHMILCHSQMLTEEKSEDNPSPVVSFVLLCFSFCFFWEWKTLCLFQINLFFILIKVDIQLGQ